MSDISADLHNSRDWNAALDRKFRSVEQATQRGVREGLRIVERSEKKILRTYTHPPGTPTTSPPGEPPALVTGNLMRSVKSRGPYPGKRPHQTVGTVGPTAEYARIQELGGRTGAHHRTVLPARPYVKPATDRVRSDIRRLFVRRWTDALLS